MIELSEFPYLHRVKDVDGCWVWQRKHRDGEGLATPYAYLKGRVAHRTVYEELVGPVVAGMVLDHKCHTTLCVNPNHLRQVTHQENMQNRKGASKNNRTGVRNVMLTREGTYQVRVSSNKKTHCFGTYTTLEEADMVAKAARAKLHII